MSTKRRGKKTDLGTGPTWVNPDTSSSTEADSSDETVDVSELEDAGTENAESDGSSNATFDGEISRSPVSSEEVSAPTPDEAFDPESSSVSEPPIPEPEPLPEPEPIPPTLEEQIMLLTGERDALVDRLRHFETHHGELIEQATRYNEMISGLQSDKADLASTSETLAGISVEAQKALEDLRGEHLALSLAHVSSETGLEDARAQLESIRTGKIFQFYPSQGNGTRVYVLAQNMPEAVKKFEDAGGNHDDVGHVSVVVDKLLI